MKETCKPKIESGRWWCVETCKPEKRNLLDRLAEFMLTAFTKWED